MSLIPPIGPIGPIGSSGCAVPLVCDVSGSVAKDAAGAVLSTLSSSLAATAGWLMGHLIDLVNATTTIGLDAGWFAAREQAMFGIAAVVVLPVLLAATIGPVLRQDLRALGRVWLVGLPVSLVAGLLGVQLVQIGLGVSDDLCRIIVGQSAWRFGGRFTGLVQAGVLSGAPSLVTAVVSLLLIVGAVVVWLDLIVRAAAVYIAVFFMPLALVGFIWPATAAMAKRTVELLVALILSKFVIVAALTLGSAALSTSSTADAAVAGGAILLLAGFAPFALLRLAPIVEFAAMAHLEGLGRRPFRAPVQAGGDLTAVHTGASVLRSFGGSHWGPDAAQTIGSVSIPEREPAFPFPSASPYEGAADGGAGGTAGGGSGGSGRSGRPARSGRPGRFGGGWRGRGGRSAAADRPVRATTIPEREVDFPFPSSTSFAADPASPDPGPEGRGGDDDAPAHRWGGWDDGDD